MKRLAVLLTVILLLGSAVLSVGYLYYQPFSGVDWKQNIDGNIGRVLVEGQSIYVANYSLNPAYGNYTGPGAPYSYSIYKLNATTGAIDWVSAPLLYWGLATLLSTFDRVEGPQIWLQNDTLFVGGSSSYNPSWIYNFTIYSIDSNTGMESGHQNISFNQENTLSNTTVFGGFYQFSDPYLCLSYITMSGNYTSYNPTFNSSLHTNTYRLVNDTYTRVLSSSIPVPAPTVSEPGYARAAAFGNTEVVRLNWVNKTVVENLASGNMIAYNVSTRVFAISGNDIYMAGFSNSTASVYSINSGNSSVSYLFQYRNDTFNSIDNYSSFYMFVLPGMNFVVSVSSIGIFDFNTAGEQIWHFTYSSKEENAQLTYSSGSGLFLSSEIYISTMFATQAYFAVINYTNGHVMWEHDYISSASRNGERGFMAPPFFGGQIVVFNDHVLYRLNNQIELAKLPR